jgi:hypothetical protein
MKVEFGLCTKFNRLCRHGDENCVATAENKFGIIFLCTRSKGHSGQHVACGSGSTHNYLVWGKEEKEKEIYRRIVL